MERRTVTCCERAMQRGVNEREECKSDRLAGAVTDSPAVTGCLRVSADEPSGGGSMDALCVTAVGACTRAVCTASLRSVLPGWRCGAKAAVHTAQRRGCDCVAVCGGLPPVAALRTLCISRHATEATTRAAPTRFCAHSALSSAPFHASSAATAARPEVAVLPRSAHAAS